MWTIPLSRKKHSCWYDLLAQHHVVQNQAIFPTMGKSVCIWYRPILYLSEVDSVFVRRRLYICQTLAPQKRQPRLLFPVRRSLVLSLLPLYCTTVLYYCTVLLYCPVLYYCSVILFCTIALSCTIIPARPPQNGQLAMDTLSYWRRVGACHS